MQVCARSQPPQILYVSREFWKPGSQAALSRIEAKAARICIQLGVPHPYLGIESLTGSKEVWYLNGFTSADDMAQVADQYNKNPKLLAAMKQFSEERAEFRSSPDKLATATYRPELSRGNPWSIGQGRFLVIVVTKDSPPHDGTVFETTDGERFIVTPARTRAEAEAKLSSAGPAAKIFAIRPRFSMPAAAWIAGDPSFWRK
jgi:hypothetical protein